MVMMMVEEHGDEGHLLDLSASAVQVTATHDVTVLDQYRQAA
jgi:hypothetical protein